MLILWLWVTFGNGDGYGYDHDYGNGYGYGDSYGYVVTSVLSRVCCSWGYRYYMLQGVSHLRK